MHLTSASPLSGVCVHSLQVREAVREVLVVTVFGLLDHLVLWRETKQNMHIQTSLTLTATEIIRNIPRFLHQRAHTLVEG